MKKKVTKPKVRREWEINPKTRVRDDKRAVKQFVKLYDMVKDSSWDDYSID